MPEPVPFALPDIDESDVDAVTTVLRSKWLTSGRECEAFEREFADRVGAEHALAVNSCTAALHLSLEALGVGPGDSVFVPTYTFAASAEVVRYVGATPVLVDSDPATGNISTVALRAAIQKQARSGRPKVIMPVHFSGVACDMDEIWLLAREYELDVVEDAAHAFPAEYHGRVIGSGPPEDVRATTCFSFYATKTITTGEGGLVATNDPELADRMRVMSLHGLSKQAWKRYAGGTWKYDIVAPGYKYNLTDIAAALGRNQLRRADQMRERREQIARQYTLAFAEHPAFEVPVVPDGRVTSWHLYTLRLKSRFGETDRDQLIDALKGVGIGASMHFIPLHTHSYYRETYGYQPTDLPNALDIYQRSLSLPFFSAMTDDQVSATISQVCRLGYGLLDSVGSAST